MCISFFTFFHDFPNTPPNTINNQNTHAMYHAFFVMIVAAIGQKNMPSMIAVYIFPFIFHEICKPIFNG